MGNNDLVMENAFVDFNKRLGILASGDYSVTPEVFEKIVRDNVTGTPVETSAKIQDVFFDNVRMYLVDTNQAMLLNDVTNTNMFLRESMTKELEKTTTLRDKTFNHIHKARQRYLNKKYAIKENQFITTLLQFTVFTILVIALIFGGSIQEAYYSLKTAAIISSIVALFYLVVVIMFLKQNQLRRKDDWDKFYFPTKYDNRSAGSCGK